MKITIFCLCAILAAAQAGGYGLLSSGLSYGTGLGSLDNGYDTTYYNSYGGSAYRPGYSNYGGYSGYRRPGYNSYRPGGYYGGSSYYNSGYGGSSYPYGGSYSSYRPYGSGYDSYDGYGRYGSGSSFLGGGGYRPYSGYQYSSYHRK